MEKSIRDQMIEFLKTRPDVILDYVESMDQSIRKRAQRAFEQGISLEEYERRFIEDVESYAISLRLPPL